MRKFNLAFALTFFLLAPLMLRADVVLPVTSYSMFNGGASTYDYRDTSYLPCPLNNCDTTGALLTGGTGKLTDGVIPTIDWTAGNPEGWVGWDNEETNGSNPVVTFNFGALDTIHSISVWYDSTFSGAEASPGEILVNGMPFFPPQTQSNTGPTLFTITGLNITGSSVNVQFDQPSFANWIMIGEVTFSGTTPVSAVPEPSPVLLLLPALSACLLLIRKQDRG